MVKEAQSHSDEDKKRRETVDLRNQADTLAYSVEKLVKENREKLGEDEARTIEEAVAEARKAAEGEDAAALKSAVDRLTGLSHKVAETLYKKTGAATDAPAGGPGGGPGPSGTAGGDGGGRPDDVVDAEYTVKN
jgi:molecular chaperone DnaK